MADRNDSNETRYWPHRQYLEVLERSLANPEAFWAEEARKLDWVRTWDKVLNWDLPFAKWFDGGLLNACYNCVDRHAKGPRKSRVAIYWEGEPGDSRAISYGQLYREVNRYASALRKLGVGKGDFVGLYLPMIPELPMFMLACARIGAIFTAVFSGFSASSLGDRLNETEAKVLVTADGGFRRGHIFPLKQVADRAIEECPSVESIIVVKRTGNEVVMKEGRDHWLHDLLKDAELYVEPEPVESIHPLYVLYTSGTTGKPKGIVHSTGGYLTYALSTYEWVFDTDEDSVFWCSADIGWVTGHTYIVFAPLAKGDTSIIYEGAPNYPNVERWWEIIEKYGVTTFYTSPTAIRMFMAQGGDGPSKHDLSSLKLLGSVGEPINPEAWMWYYKNIGRERCPIVDTWWQTETGAILISGAPGIWPVLMKPSSASLPLPGIDADVLDREGTPAEPGTRGVVVIRKPWPGMLMTIYKDPERYKETYWSQFDGCYYAGDYAIKDEDGYFWFLGRADEVLKVAGHRLGTLEIENATVEHPAVAEAAAVGREDKIKGEAVVVFAILREGHKGSPELEKEVQGHIRNTLGAVARPDNVYFVKSLPKTRSGKIMRRVLRAVASDQAIGDVTTLEDEASVEEVKQAYEELRSAM